jgi:hypothetical protein
VPRSVYNIDPKLDYFLGRIGIEANDTRDAHLYRALNRLWSRPFVEFRHVVPDDPIITRWE